MPWTWWPAAASASAPRRGRPCGPRCSWCAGTTASSRSASGAASKASAAPTTSPRASGRTGPEPGAASIGDVLRFSIQSRSNSEVPSISRRTKKHGSVFICRVTRHPSFPGHILPFSLLSRRDSKMSSFFDLNCVDWSLLPPPTEEMVAMTAALKGRFQGDPSYEYEQPEKKEDAERPYEEEAGSLLKEEIRLVATVHQIDKAVGIVPRGAYVKSPLGPVHENRNFEGLSLTEGKKLSSYFHFTEPEKLKNKTLLEKADLDPAIDFLDSLEHDIPKGSWSIQVERGGRVIVLRSLLWLGLTFYHVPNTKQHGYIYFGNGEKNIDLPFML